VHYPITKNKTKTKNTAGFPVATFSTSFYGRNSAASMFYSCSCADSLSLVMHTVKACAEGGSNKHVSAPLV